MVEGGIDFKKEQERTLARPHLRATGMARLLFWGMDVAYGRKTTLPKVRLLEILARIPYQAWETSQYARLSRRYGSETDVARATEILEWGRRAQDNEFWHLRVIERRMQQTGLREGPFWTGVAHPVVCFKYALFSRLLARARIDRAFHMNAEFEDHAERTYMQFVTDHPELEEERPEDPLVNERGPYASWADVFRRIALDERDHMNDSFRHCGMGERVAAYADGRS